MASKAQSITDVVTEGARIRIVYRDGANEITERVIDVERVWECKGGATCILAFCHRRNERRTFDQARILAAMTDDSTTITSFAMSAAVTRGDTDAFSRAYQAVRAA
jgi:predicted DNA-binding transcriptional regulator YafY